MSKSSQQIEVALFEPSMTEEWEALADRSPQAWFYHKRDVIEVVNRAHRLQDRSLVAVKNGHIVALLPLNRTIDARWPAMSSISFGCAGVACDPLLGGRETDAVCEALLERAACVARQDRCNALEFSLPALAPAQLANRHGVSPLDTLGFSPTSTSTYILELAAGEEALFANLRPVARQLIHKAEKAGVVIRAADRPSDFDAYYQMHCLTYERTGARPHSREYFEGIFQRLVPRGFSKIYAAEHEGRPIAFANIASYKNKALFWTGCSAVEALDIGANYQLQWHVIRAAQQEGAEFYEVGEAFPGHRGDKLAGLNTFKAAFGGERRPYHKGRIALPPEKKPSRLRVSLYYLKQACKTLLSRG